VPEPLVAANRRLVRGATRHFAAPGAGRRGEFQAAVDAMNDQVDAVSSARRRSSCP
jgi:hypothetical protein